LVLGHFAIHDSLILYLPAFYQVSVDWVKAFTNFTSFRFADTLNTRSAELTAEALPFAITPSQPDVQELLPYKR